MEALSRLVAAVAPVAGHLLERLAFGFGHQAEHKPCGEDTYHAIERVCEHVAETIAHRAEFHVIHRNECRRHYEVEYHWKATAMAIAALRMVLGKISEMSTQHIGPHENMKHAE